MISLIVLGLSLLALGWYYLKHHYSYWERRGFPADKNASIPFGCLGSVLKMQKAMGMAVHDVYLQSKERFLGTYLLFRPAVLVRDAELARRVLAQDFASFHDRGMYVDEEKDPLSASIFALPGQSWRSMRQKLSPCFTSGKLKAMYSTGEDIGNKMVNHLQKELPEQGSKEVDLKAVMQIYAIDIIGSTIFGLDINSYEQPDNKFRKLVTALPTDNRLMAYMQMLVILIPSVARMIFSLRLPNAIGAAMLAIVKDTMEQREKQGIVRKDMMQLFMQLRNKGSVDEDDSKTWSLETTDDGHLKSMSLEAITAQATVFYFAGQETTGSTAAFTIFELAQNPEHLERLQNEVDETLKQNNGQISYDVLNKMEFLDLCVTETLRKYPGLPMLNRECTKDFTLPDTDYVIKKGTPVVISLYGIHRDSEYFPDPDKYDPNRFAEETKNYNPVAYMPFGDGPRICIAQRMGRINSKLAIVKILQHFDIEVMSKRELEYEPSGFPLVPKDGAKVRLSKRTTLAQ
ncbi:probable cytochrome P450 6d4 isoform X1 [Drosophila albomicans]|uniref:Probable cytochrome P450 6d4 isoform X1 n=1 Tax=Drosophila albomicans TaxID=7291 RepID=A0A6P8XJN8_DROAB|nr:probable cytochrome P450 6d4 isoform X1 [Drosophila albomicans]